MTKAEARVVRAAMRLNAAGDLMAFNGRCDCSSCNLKRKAIHGLIRACVALAAAQRKRGK